MFIDEEAVTEMLTILDILRWTVSRFNSADIYYGHGTDNSLDEAIHLVFPTLFLHLDITPEMHNARLTSSERTKIIQKVIRRIKQKIPVPYLTNQAWFCGLEFYVDERVLIPRSPIGELINNKFFNILDHAPKNILDMCTGSGCIAISTALTYPESQIEAVDISTEVLEVTKKNIKKHSVENNVIPICSDLFKNLSKTGRYDLIIANPPYVDEKTMKELPQEFLYEPIIGLAAGVDGLQFIHRILASAYNYLSDDGKLICEVGYHMITLTKLYPEINFNWVNINNGGEGVFMLTRQQLIDCRNIFKIYID